jgi:hypothetical protein
MVRGAVRGERVEGGHVARRALRLLHGRLGILAPRDPRVWELRKVVHTTAMTLARAG